MAARVLVIDDDKHFGHMLAQRVQSMGHTAVVAYTLEEGLERAGASSCDVILLDVNLPDGSGLEAIPKLQQGDVPPEIIIITGFGEPDGAELAMRSGVWDYIDKGTSLESAKLSLTRAIQYRAERQAARRPVLLKTEGVIGESRCFKACMELVAQAADSNTNVLLAGATGTGKEVLARTIHWNSARANGSFVVVDCAALPETLIESVLFGHEKGAFTGADLGRDGLVKEADGGTLFLDEVGELPRSMQKTFLRVLQERRCRAVGAEKETSSDFRLVAATNRDLAEMASDGHFREDLLFRLRGLTIELPPPAETEGRH